MANPHERYYARQLERLLGEPVSAVRKELGKFETAGLLSGSREGTVKYYAVNREFPVFEELKSLILKTQAMGDYLRVLIKHAHGVKLAFIYGSVAEGLESRDSDIDVMIVGTINPVILHRKISEIETALKREIQYSLMGEAEFAARNDEFIRRIVKGRKIFLIGNEQELRAIRKGR